MKTNSKIMALSLFAIVMSGSVVAAEAPKADDKAVVVSQPVVADQVEQAAQPAQEAAPVATETKESKSFFGWLKDLFSNMMSWLFGKKEEAAPAPTEVTVPVEGQEAPAIPEIPAIPAESKSEVPAAK